MKTLPITNESDHIDAISHVAERLGLDVDDADTLMSDIIPVLKRKYDLLSRGKKKIKSIEERAKKIIRNELPVVLSNYALTDLTSNKKVIVYILENLSPELIEMRVKNIADKRRKETEPLLAEELAEQLGIRNEHVDHFKKSLLPKLKKYAKSMYRQKVQSGELNKDSANFNEFIIDNVFIDEFENHVYIRSVTDKDNRAILPPEAKTIAMKMLDAWKSEVFAEKKP